MKRLVVKIGSSTLTTGEGRIDHAYLDSFARQIEAVRAQGWQVVVVSSGAIACGLERLGMSGKRPDDMPTLQAAASVGQGMFASAWGDAFASHGMTTSIVLLTRRDTADRTAYLHARDTLERLLDLGVVPIVNENDTVSVEQIRFGDNDTLCALVACLINADLAVILSDIDGLYDANPAKDANAKLIRRVTRIDQAIIEAAGDAGTAMGSGGMITKVKAARVLGVAGIPLVICAGRQVDAIVDAAAGREVGTLFTAEQAAHEITPRKLWIALAIRRAGPSLSMRAPNKRSSARAARCSSSASPLLRAISRTATSWTSSMSRVTCSHVAAYPPAATRQNWLSGAHAKSSRATACLPKWRTNRSSTATTL